MTDKNHIMFDIETLGTGSNSVILSIAAVEFNARTGKTGATFYYTISRSSCLAAGLKEDAATIEFWNRQNPATFKALKQNTKPLEQVLDRLDNFFKSRRDHFVWGNSARFDLGIISDAYRILGRRAPWNFRNENCYRTLVNIHPECKEGVINEEIHNAVADCNFQIKVLSKVWNKLYPVVEQKPIQKELFKNKNGELYNNILPKSKVLYLKCKSIAATKSDPKRYFKNDFDKFNFFFKDCKAKGIIPLVVNYDDSNDWIKIIELVDITPNIMRTGKEFFATKEHFRKKYLLNKIK